MKYVASHVLERCRRVDVAFDGYHENSIKGGTRVKRKHGEGKGIKRNADSREQKLNKWRRFFILDENKNSLESFLLTTLSPLFCENPRKELKLGGGLRDPMKVFY